MMGTVNELFEKIREATSNNPVKKKLVNLWKNDILVKWRHLN